MGTQIAFWALAFVIIISALGVVVFHNVFRAALVLIVCFIGIAGIYILLSAEFLAIVQILIYVGGISILILLAILLTHDLPHGNPANKMRIPAFVIAVLFMGLVIYSVMSTTFPISAQPPSEPTTSTIGQMLLNQNGWLITTQLASVLLLAAILGAVVMAREK